MFCRQPPSGLAAERVARKRHRRVDFGKALHGFCHIEQTHLVCIQHGATAENGEAITREVNHVDVAGLASNTLFKM